MSDLTTFEKNVILSAAALPQTGERRERVMAWGAAVGSVMERLTRLGYLRPVASDGGYWLTHEATPAGVRAAQAGGGNG